jgi:gluconate 2-dehydrogenase gamma chain
MASYSSDRRSLLKIIGAIGATCAYPFASDELLGQTAPAHDHPPEAGRSAARFLNDRDFATISRISELIIPATDTPGAIGAGVPEYIDFVIGRNTDQQLVVADGLRWLDAEAARRENGKTFAALTEEQQLSLLLPLCEAADAADPLQMLKQARTVQFFALMKGLTADGYYTSRIGLLQELGYKGNKVRADFPSCENPSKV